MNFLSWKVGVPPRLKMINVRIDTTVAISSLDHTTLPTTLVRENYEFGTQEEANGFIARIESWLEDRPVVDLELKPFYRSKVPPTVGELNRILDVMHGPESLWTT